MLAALKLWLAEWSPAFTVLLDALILGLIAWEFFPSRRRTRRLKHIAGELEPFFARGDKLKLSYPFPSSSPSRQTNHAAWLSEFEKWERETDSRLRKINIQAAYHFSHRIQGNYFDIAEYRVDALHRMITNPSAFFE